MQKMTLPFSDWTPDLASIDIGGIYDVDGVYPRTASYSPWRSMVAFSDALNSACIGVVAARDPDGNTALFAGTTTKLYKLTNSSSVWSDVSRSGSAYAVPSLEFWSFGQFGANLIGVNIDCDPQKYVMGTSTLFDVLGGSPPKARHIGIVRDFVVFGNLTSAANKIQWSAFNNSEGWTVGTNQSDDQTFPEGGSVQGIVGGEVGYVIQEQSIRRMTYVGGDVIFVFDEIEHGRGTRSPKSIVQYGTGFFYYGRDGFYYFNGQTSLPIGAQKIDIWFATQADPSYIQSMVGAYDPIRKLVLWSFVSTGGSTSTKDTMLIYNPACDKWAKVTQSVEYVAQTTSPGYTLEGLDTIGTDIDAFTVSLDSPIWAGGALAVVGFDSTHKAGAFSGDTLAATVTTQEKMIFPGQFAFLNAGLPIVDTSGATLSIGTRSRYADTPAYTTASSMQVNGVCPVRARGRSIHAKMAIPAATEWTHAEGVSLEARADGMR